MKPPTSILKFCRDCKFFKPQSDPKIDLQFGKCTFYKSIDMVTGRIYYNYASVARMYMCHGESFVSKQDPLSSFIKTDKK
jgi:hypothetical protein